MIKRVFLGPVWHWLLIIVGGASFWWLGSQRLHVIEFNLFVTAVLLGTAVCVFLILVRHTAGHQITRDPLVPSDQKETG